MNVRGTWTAALVLLALAGGCMADIYMHNLRGSNDRNREENTNRNNAQRLFDSQNNAKGGYCWGPPLYYYAGSIVTVEWTNQHGCGKDQANMHCEVVLQYMCGADVRDGLTTDTIPEDSTANATQTVTDECWFENGNRQCTYDPDNWNEDTMGPRSTLVQKTSVYGMHEPYQHWLDCKTRERNKGLFTADQNPGNQARSTRQNPGGTRHGYECAEERDYYPYWHPSPWRDIAVMTSDKSRCGMYRRESQNVKDKNYCSLPQYNNEAACSNGGGDWRRWSSYNVGAPQCVDAPWSRDNHLGNSKGGYASSFNWTVPDYPSESRYCVMRIRYNTTSGDFDGWNTYSTSNAPRSPVTNDPYVPYGTWGMHGGPSDKADLPMNLSLAINTAQFSRTFQDRSHTFVIRPRPSNIPSNADIYNINVRGKRGNIVQVYPAVEYDFVPNVLHIYNGDYVHFHWTGCDHNPNGNDGEGKRQTDRSNVVELKTASGNYFKAFDDFDFFSSSSNQYNIAHLHQNRSFCLTLDELRTKHNNNNGEIEQDDANCMKLNAAGRDYHGFIQQVQSRHTGRTYAYMSSRNNNFTNRSQKGYLIVGNNPSIPRWLIAIIAVLSIGAITLVVVPFGLLVPTVVVVLGNALAQRL